MAATKPDRMGPAPAAPDFTPAQRAAVLKGLWGRIVARHADEIRGHVCQVLPGSMPPRKGNPEQLAKLKADPSYGFEEVPE